MIDVVIIGAGPAGLTLGCYLAKAGIDHVILDKAIHPRPHVGESMMPAAVRIFREIGFIGLVDAAGFPRSHGVVYHPADGDKPVSVAYDEFPQQGVMQGHTYHVDRSKFDMLLMKHAEARGCRMLLGADVKEVLFDAGGRARGVSVHVADQEVEIQARIVVDAGGRDTLIGRQLELRGNHPELDQIALHAWFIDVDRGRRKTSDYTQVFFLPSQRSWAWQAPIDDDITSVGIVADRGSFQRSGWSPAEFFESSVQSNPALRRAMKKAGRINDLKGEASYSYRLDRICGDGWLVVGDAARFLDPVFSSGVCVAMHSAKFAAEGILAALASGDTSREGLLPYEERMTVGAAIWEDFVRLYYRLRPVFTHFLESADHRLGILRLLQGEVYDRDDASVLGEIRRFVREVEGSDDHPLRDALADIRPA